MSTYVFSDVHGHRAPLERVLERISPSEEDCFFCLGDMIDRGPDPVGVLRIVRALPNVRVLMGNHEDLMVSCIDHPHDPLATMNWGINGGSTTSDGLAEISAEFMPGLTLTPQPRASGTTRLPRSTSHRRTARTSHGFARTSGGRRTGSPGPTAPGRL